jgi:trans-aconitate methyltransferase
MMRGWEGEKAEFEPSVSQASLFSNQVMYFHYHEFFRHYFQEVKSKNCTAGQLSQNVDE